MRAPLAVSVAVTAWLLGFAAGTSPAAAQGARCFPVEVGLAALQDQFGETPAYLAVTAAGALMTVTVNLETGTWSVLLSADNRLACLVANGDGWSAAPAPPMPEGRS